MKSITRFAVASALGAAVALVVQVASAQTDMTTRPGPQKGTTALNPQPEVPSKPVAGKPLTNPADANKALPAQRKSSSGMGPNKGLKELNPQPEVPSKPTKEEKSGKSGQTKKKWSK